MSKAKIAGSLALLSETFEKPLTEETIKSYLIALDCLTADEIQNATTAAIRTMKWFPKPFELIRLATGTTEQQCEKAWSQLLLALDAYGSCDEVIIGDPALVGTIKSMGGLRVIANTPTKNLHAFSRRQFDTTYKSLIGTSGKPFGFKTSRKIPQDPITKKLLRDPVRRSIGTDVLLIESEGNSEVKKIAGEIIEALK
ncbi:hypothetical protein N9049_01735 [bacterium]|nr:hypothetical protein [bacterium]